MRREGVDRVRIRTVAVAACVSGGVGDGGDDGAAKIFRIAQRRRRRAIRRGESTERTHSRHARIPIRRETNLLVMLFFRVVGGPFSGFLARRERVHESVDDPEGRKIPRVVADAESVLFVLRAEFPLRRATHGGRSREFAHECRRGGDHLRVAVS